MRKQTYTNAKKNGRIVRMNPKEETFKAIGVFITPQSRSIKAILETRLERVRHLLLNADTRIEDIAEECGWNTSIALKSLFKRRYGMSMRDYRKRKAEVRALPLTRGRPQTMPG